MRIAAVSGLRGETARKLLPMGYRVIPSWDDVGYDRQLMYAAGDAGGVCLG